MSKRTATTILPVSNSADSSGFWDKAIGDAQQMIAEVRATTRKRVDELKASIKMLEELRDSGARLPGTQERDN